MPPTETGGNEIRLADFYCGVGGLSLGARMASLFLGARLRPEIAVDRDRVALGVYARNFSPATTLSADADTLVDYRIGDAESGATLSYPPGITDRLVIERIERVDLFVAGPPCQGHSNLNNRTRRDDPRNRSYLAAVATAIAAEARAVVVENVREASASKGGEVADALSILRGSGYDARTFHLNASDFGVAQSRRRSFLVATLAPLNGFEERIEGWKLPPSTIGEAIGDLQDLESAALFDRSTQSGETTAERIAWLFENDEYDLAEHMRPDCHRRGPHTYGDVYGRLREDGIAGTITGGFTTMGRGRFVHPTRRRCLTPHEGARLQGFPDWFRFRSPDGSELSQEAYRKLIGNAVPPPLAAVVCASALMAVRNPA